MEEVISGIGVLGMRCEEFDDPRRPTKKIELGEKVHH
jgi:hypothetical protein